jgi:uncharacterized protein YutE (UPF0331/DUF86 family)
MVDRDVLASRLSALDGYLAELRSLRTASREEFVAEPALHHLAERFVHLACEAILDLAHHVVSDEGLRQPATYREAMQVLAEGGFVNADLAVRLADWVGLRNVLVHLYLNIDHGRVWDALHEDFGDLDAFAAAMAELLD